MNTVTLDEYLFKIYFLISVGLSMVEQRYKYVE